MIAVYTEVEKRAGYKRFLKSRINGLLGRPVLLDSLVNPRGARNRLSVIGMQILNAAAFPLLIDRLRNDRDLLMRRSTDAATLAARFDSKTGVQQLLDIYSAE